MKRSLGFSLAEGPPLLFDGGLATELELRGADLSGGLWSGRCLMEDPDLIRQLHRDYLNAGVDVLTTSSYQLSYLGAKRAGLEPRDIDSLIGKSIKIAEEACTESQREDVFVAVSFGPYGAAIPGGHEYDGRYGTINQRDLRQFHKPRLQAALDHGGEVFILETFPRRDEILLVAELAADLGIRDLILSLQLRSADRLGSGERLIETIQELSTEAAVTAIGINCCAPSCATAALNLLIQTCLKPIIVQANSGETYSGHAWSKAPKSADYLTEAARWLDQGARGLGGCCRIGPRTIKALRLQNTRLTASEGRNRSAP